MLSTCPESFVKTFVEREFPKLLDLLYDAALDPLRWQAFLDALPARFGNATGVLHLFNAHTETIPFFATFGGDPAFAASYADYYAGINPYASVKFHKLPVGKVVPATDVLASALLERSEFFHDWMRPQGIPTDHFGVPLRNDGDSVAVLSVAPNAAAHAKGRQQYGAQLRLLVPHMVRALEMNAVVSAARQAKLSSNAALDSLGSAAFLLGASGRLLVASAQAEALLRGNNVVKLDRFKVLRAVNSGEDMELSAAVRRCATEPGNPSARPLRLTSRATEQAYVAWVVPLQPVRDHAPGRRLELFSRLAPQPTVLVMLASAHNGIDIPADTIQAIFRLSAAEARLVNALVGGRSLAEYAAGAGLSRNTARNQLASTFLKTGTTRQTELVVMVVRALGTGAAPTNPMARA